MRRAGSSIRAGLVVGVLLALPSLPTHAQAANHIGVGDARLSASFYSDASCLLTINAFVQSGTTVIDADVDAAGSRMLLHCDTEDGRRLTLLARGDSLNVAQRAPLLNREEIEEGDFGMLAWLTRSGVHYSDDDAPRRYVIGGSVTMRKSPPTAVAGTALNSSKQSFASINGVLESIVKSGQQNVQQTPQQTTVANDSNSRADDMRKTSASVQNRVGSE